MKSRSTLILWGFLQLILGVSLHHWARNTDLGDYLFWFGILNLTIWFFIGQSSSILLGSRKFEDMIIANLFSNLIGILAFAIFYFGMFKQTTLHTYSHHYFFPMITMTSDLLDQDTLSQIFKLDRVLLATLLLQMLVFSIGYLVGKRR